jgi:hypothetical protein
VAEAHATQSRVSAARTRDLRAANTQRPRCNPTEPGTVPDVQHVYFWFSKPAPDGSVCGNLLR